MMTEPSPSTGSTDRPSNWNIANQVTAARLIASLILFVVLHFARVLDHRSIYLAAVVLFLLAAATDWVDGYLARSRNIVTKLGRIMDPLADKIIVCGTFVFLSSIERSGVAAWMTVVVVCRELVVTVLRSFLEQNGKDFSAKMPGKLKMVFQCAVTVASLWMLAESASGGTPAAWLPPTVSVLAWIMVLSTLYSGILYLPAAAQEIRDI